MPTGRHARPNDEPAAIPAAGLLEDAVAPVKAATKVLPASEAPRTRSVSTPVQVATPAGRRARPVSSRPAVEAPAPVAVPELVADAPAAAAPTTGTGRRRKTATAEPEAPLSATPAPAPTGSGRRRKPPAEALAPETVAPATPATVPAGTGRRRKAPVEAAPLPVEVVEAAATPGAGRRRATPAPAPVADVQPKPEPTVEGPSDDDSPLAPVVPISAARRATGATGARRKARTSAVPGAPALVAGAAAVAVAAVGALGAAGSGNAGLGSTDLARASAAGLTVPGLSPADQQQLLERNAARASRERARQALAKRQKESAAKKAKQVAAAKALKLAKERAARLERLAKSYRMPVQGYRITAGFGAHGLWSSSHTGTDFACPYGTVIRAVGSGRIVSAGWDGAYGWKTVQILNDGTEIWYAHQSKMLVKSGYVNAGDPIGRVGTTGNTTGPHLHMEVRINDKPINPISWLRARGLMR